MLCMTAVKTVLVLLSAAAELAWMSKVRARVACWDARPFILTVSLQEEGRWRRCSTNSHHMNYGILFAKTKHTYTQTITLRSFGLRMHKLQDLSAQRRPEREICNVRRLQRDAFQCVLYTLHQCKPFLFCLWRQQGFCWIVSLTLFSIHSLGSGNRFSDCSKA